MKAQSQRATAPIDGYGELAREARVPSVPCLTLWIARYLKDVQLANLGGGWLCRPPIASSHELAPLTIVTEQSAAPHARIVKAFNTIAAGSVDTSPELLRQMGAQTFLAGQDAAAKTAAAAIAADLGFETIDVGASVAAFRATEALGDVIRLLMIDGGRGAAFTLH